MMHYPPLLIIFGEVLFDCFSDGERILGGAPFNVAWHLQALGDQPRFISRVGEDEFGSRILQAMRGWGMDNSAVEVDSQHPTGQVRIELLENEPQYEILPDCAYDFIAGPETLPNGGGILYHGSLALRNEVSRTTFKRVARVTELPIFLDVNLRSPWWQADTIQHWLDRAHWVKLNQSELRQLGFTAEDVRQAMAEMLDRFRLAQLILTRGAAGAMVLTAAGDWHEIAPEAPLTPIDSVGAGDAFSAIYLHGLLAGWPTQETLAVAQRFAARVLAIRGAIAQNPAFYRGFASAVG